MNATQNGAAAPMACTCLNRFDHCAYCQRLEAEAKVNLPAPPPAPPAEVAPKRRGRPPGRKNGANPPATPPPELLTVHQVAKMLSMGVRTVWRLTELGKLPQPWRHGRKLVRWPRASIQAFIDGLTQPPPAA